LLVQDIPVQLQRECGFQEEAEEAVFTQVTAAVDTFRDAVRFQNGVEVLLQRLIAGQRVRVLDLSSAEDQEPASQGRRRAMV
jgi:redox-regulated HSP33 family molecular chaperone